MVGLTANREMTAQDKAREKMLAKGHNTKRAIANVGKMANAGATARYGDLALIGDGSGRLI